MYSVMLSYRNHQRILTKALRSDTIPDFSVITTLCGRWLEKETEIKTETREKRSQNRPAIMKGSLIAKPNISQRHKNRRFSLFAVCLCLQLLCLPTSRDVLAPERHPCCVTDILPTVTRCLCRLSADCPSRLPLPAVLHGLRPRPEDPGHWDPERSSQIVSFPGLWVALARGGSVGETLAGKRTDVWASPRQMLRYRGRVRRSRRSTV